MRTLIIEGLYTSIETKPLVVTMSTFWELILTAVILPIDFTGLSEKAGNDNAGGDNAGGDKTGDDNAAGTNKGNVTASSKTAHSGLLNIFFIG